MKFVVDASVIIAVIANKPEKDQLIEITKGADLLALLRSIGKLAMPFQR